MRIQESNKGFEINSISLDTDESKWKKAIIKDSCPLPQMIDTNSFDGEFSRYYLVEAIPFNLLLDREGKLIEVDPALGIIEDILNKAL